MASLWPARRAKAWRSFAGGDEIGTAAGDGGAGAVS